MAYTKESIFSKIGELLVELNDGYTELSESNEGGNAVNILLLEARAKFLTTHFEVLRQLDSSTENKPSASAIETDVIKSEDTKEIIFTPPVVLNEAADKQSVEKEIEEEKPNPEESSAGAPESVEEPEEKQSSPVSESDNGDANSSQNIASEQEDEDASNDEVVDSPVLEDERTQKDSSDQQTETVAQSEEAAQVVVNEVIQEPKEIVIEAKPVQEETKPTRPLTLNEMLQQQRQSSFNQGSNNTAPTPAVKAPENKVLDLKTVINLNDKLLFIKDLFNGYSLAYSEAIELLNRYSTFAEADVFLQTNYALKNNWADKPQTVDKLYAVLRKKFM